MIDVAHIILSHSPLQCVMNNTQSISERVVTQSLRFSGIHSGSFFNPVIVAKLYEKDHLPGMTKDFPLILASLNAT